MSPPGKKKQPPSRLQRLKARFAGPAGGLFFCLVLAGMFFAVRYFWQKYSAKHSEAYSLNPESFDLSPPPPSWIPAQPDLREEVFRELIRDRRPSRLDDDLAERLAAAFQRQPWIAQVRRVQPLQTGQVKIDVTYRQPALMVDLPGGIAFVDAQGIVLPPAGFTPVEAAKYPRLSGVELRLTAVAGQRWMDGRVLGGAEIAAALSPVWEAYQMRQIVPVGDVSGENSFTIFTRGLSGVKRILWGVAPAKPGAAGPTPAQKMEKLRALAAEFGSLEHRSAPEEIDLRNL
jgi:hypothetical protein